MKKEELRPIILGHNMRPENGFFHKWFIKTFDDEPGKEHPYALVELENGTIREVRASEVKFADRP